MKIKSTLFLALLTLLLWGALPCVAADPMVDSWYGTYDAMRKNGGFPSKSLEGPKSEAWKTPTPKRPYHIGVLFPHLKDSYWLAANYGIVDHARKLGLRITLKEAGGYENFGNQRSQLTKLASAGGVDGIILASVSYDTMDAALEMVSRKVPVIELINDIRAPSIKGKSLVSFFEMGYKAGEFVLADSGGKNVRVAFFPGPAGSGWAPDTYKGFRAAVNTLKGPGQNVTVLEPAYGDTTQSVQKLRLKVVLGKPENKGIDYIVGNAVAAVIAADYVKQHKDEFPKTRVISTYITIDVHERIKAGEITAAPSDQTIAQCRMSLDMMVRLLNGETPGKDFPFRSGPKIPVVTSDNLDAFPYEALFGKKNFKPVFEVSN